jgi:hypothetical protein
MEINMTLGIKLPNIVEALENKFRAAIRVFNAKSIHASQIGGPCECQLVYDQVAGNKAPHDVDTEMVFSMGRLLEEQANVDLAEAFKGNDSVQVQRERLPLPPNQWNIGGQLDFSICQRIDKVWSKYPMEFKSASPFVFERINTVADMLDDQSFYVRKYPAQIQIYMLMTNTEHGMFLLRNKLNGKYKQIEVALDLDYSEQLLQKAERINTSIAKYRQACDDEGREKALPKRIGYSSEVCGSCPFRGLCVPDLAQAEGIVNMLSDTELASLCRIRAMNAESVEEYNEADEKISEHCKAVVSALKAGAEKVILVDGFSITVKVSKTKKYEIPDDIKEKYCKEGKMVRRTIEPITNN